MAISRYFLPYTYIAKSQLSSVNCQPKATPPRKQAPKFTHRQTTSFSVANYQLPGSKLSVSRRETPVVSVTNSRRHVGQS